MRWECRVFAALRSAFERALTIFVIVLLAALAAVVLLGVACRKFDIPLVWYDEGASIMLAWMTYYGAALAALKRAHIGFPGLVNAMPPRLRVPQGKWRVKMFQAYGANPSPMALSEVFVALQTGVMDGQENPLTQIYSSKFQEVQKYLSMTGHVYTPAYLVSGKTKFASLPPDVQAILQQAAKDTQAYVYEQAAKLDNELLDKIKAAGVKVNEADKDAFIAASKGVYEEFGKEVADGAKLVNTAIELGKGM